MMSLQFIIAVTLFYSLLLFLVAYIAEQRVRAGRAGILHSPVVYTLSLSVYCTAWTFYGAVGSAARNGLEFITIYLGPTLVFIGWWWFLRRLVRTGRREQITSIADLLSSRYGKSTSIGVVVTLIALLGATPYIALQLQSLTLSLTVFTQNTDTVAEHMADTPSWTQTTALIVAIGLATFTIMFGTRNLNASERHEGVVTAIAIEALVKLTSLVAVGVAVVYWILSTPVSLEAPLAQLAGKASPFDQRWITLTFLSGFAIICLPRMFQVIVVENRDDRQLALASWAFPTYLFLMCLFVLPIALFGLSTLPATANPDLFVLTVPLSQGQTLLAGFAFLGGFSSATSMVIMAALALSTMVSNNIVLPLWLKISGPAIYASEDLRRLTLNSRRISIILILSLGYLYFRATGGSSALAAIGLIAFLGVAQVLPALAGGLLWRGATKAGALSGVITGSLIWLYSSFLPSFEGGLLLSPAILETGLFGLSWLKPTALFGANIADPLVHASFWSLGLNSLVFVLVSCFSRQGALERFQAYIFVYQRPREHYQRAYQNPSSVHELLALSQRIIGRRAASQLFREAARAQGKSGGLPNPTNEFTDSLERQFSAVVGAATAHALFAQMTSDRTVSVSQLVALADESAQVRAYSQQLEEKSAELETAADQLRAANMQLLQLGQQRDNFLSQVSHELRTPMASIRSFAEILQQSQTEDAEQRAHFASIIHDESIRLTKLLDNILEISFLESGHAKLDIQSVKLDAIFSRAQLALDALIRDSGAQIAINMPLDSVTLTTDADRLLQVVINLFSNAIKHNDKSVPEITVSSQQIGTGKQAKLLIQIRDNGPGIADEQRERIFEKFARITPTNSKSGVGLGLAISAQMMANLKGDLRLRESASGCLFEIILPVNLSDDMPNDMPGSDADGAADISAHPEQA